MAGSKPREPVARFDVPQILAFRMARQFVDPTTTKPAVEVVHRLCGVQAQVASAAAFAVAVRRRAARSAGVDRAIRVRTLVKTWAMRGTLHLLAADDASTVLSSLSRLQPWRSNAWQRYHGVTAAEVERFLDILPDVLGSEPLTKKELAAALARRVRSPVVREKLSSGWGELLKPAAFAGIVLQGPPRGSEVTFVRADAWVKGWRSSDPDDAGPDVVRAYLRAYGPATVQHFGDWWARQGAAKVRPWFEALGDELAPVDIGGTSSWCLAADVAEIAAARRNASVRLLGNFDQYVLGPGSGSAAFIPSQHRSAVSRTAGWISRVVLWKGMVAGVWEIEDGAIRTTLWDWVPATKLRGEIARVQPLLRAITDVEA